MKKIFGILFLMLFGLIILKSIYGEYQCYIQKETFGFGSNNDRLDRGISIIPEKWNIKWLEKNSLLLCFPLDSIGYHKGKEIFIKEGRISRERDTYKNSETNEILYVEYNYNLSKFDLKFTKKPNYFSKGYTNKK